MAMAHIVASIRIILVAGISLSWTFPILLICCRSCKYEFSYAVFNHKSLPGFPLFPINYCFTDDAHVHAASDALIHSLFKNLYYNSGTKNIIHNANYCYKGLLQKLDVSWSGS